MPFLQAPFITRLQQTFDKDASNYDEPAEGELKASPKGIKIPAGQPVKWATAWSEATAAGAQGLMTMPFPPISNMIISGGEAAMYGVLITNTPYTPPFAVLKSGFTTFASTITVGWLPTYIGIAPPGPPNFESLSQIGKASTINLPWIVQCAAMLSSWFMTGAVIPTYPVGINMGAPPSPWL